MSSACSFAYGLGKFAAKGPAFLRSVPVLIPVIATAAASCSNLAFTRSDEIMSGAVVTDEEGVARGKSVKAGIQGIAQTAISRCVLVPLVCMLMPVKLEDVMRKYVM